MGVLKSSWQICNSVTEQASGEFISCHSSQKCSENSEAYSVHCQTSMMGFKTVNYFRKKAPS